MIIDELKNIGRYAALGENFKTAAEFLANTDLAQLPLGKTTIDGDEVFVVKSRNLLDSDAMFWEAHKKYADIQVILEGSERFGYGSAELGEYDEEIDFIKCENPSYFDFVRSAGQAVVFLPREPHSPGNFVNKGDVSVKIVVKVKTN